MKFRTGRRQPRTLYLQHGPEPTESDMMIGAMDSPELSRLVADAVNAYKQKTPFQICQDDPPPAA